MLCQAAQYCTSKTTQQNETASNKHYVELKSIVKSAGSTGDMVTVTCGLKPPLWFDVWILGYLICCCSFKSAWQDKTASRFPIRTLTAQQRGRHHSQASSKLSSPFCPLCASPGCRRISYWFGAFLWNVWRITRFNLFFCFKWLLLVFSSTVTMVLFLIGISIAVNNSSHENQTAGNCCNDWRAIIQDKARIRC